MANRVLTVYDFLMALYLPTSLLAANFTKLAARSNRILVVSCSSNLAPYHLQIQCTAATKCSAQTITRRSANYQPPLWRYDYIQSLKSDYVGKSCNNRLEKLKKDVRLMLENLMDPLDQLELIDTLQRLGVYYHFEEEIKRILNTIYNNKCSNYKQEHLYAVALEFRLLRQHGYDIPTEIFNNFRDKKGSFKSCVNYDCTAILSLYEAAFLLKEGEESIFHDARDFTTTYLKEYNKHNEDQYLSTLVNHALELPLYWRVRRLEARWFIDVYEKRKDMNSILLEFAKLDFNVVQATHQEDLKYASRWWDKTAFGEKLSFARDRLMENFLWTVGVIFEPQFGYCRRNLTEVNALITTIDDVYDVYGTLDELELFTNAVERWDISGMDRLPYYMKICFLVLLNSINEMALDALKEHEVDIISDLKKAWADICQTYLVEAKWFSSGHIPTLEEYIENAWISISAPVILVHAYHFITNATTKETLGSLEQYLNIIRCSSTILRLADDLGTSSHELKRGDVSKSIQCYMHETGASEEQAREYIRELITKTWMKMNKERLENPHLSKIYVGIAMNLGRMSQCMYQFGDGHGIQDQETKERVLSLLINPIQ